MRYKNSILSAFLILTCLSCEKITWTPFDYGEYIPQEKTPSEKTLEARLADATSSTLTIQWSVSSFKDAKKDNQTSWKVGLYRDPEATQAVALWDCVSAGFFRKVKGNGFVTPCFFFTGLEPGKTWYFKAETEDCSGVFPFETTPFTLKVPEGTPAHPGDLLLAEDFSELVWGANPNVFSVGYVPFRPDRMDRIVQAGPESENDTFYLNSGEFFLPWDSFRETTRLADWDLKPVHSPAFFDPDLVWQTPLGLRLQLSNDYRDALVLPPLPGLTEPSTVRVKIKTSRETWAYSDYWILADTEVTYEDDYQMTTEWMLPLATMKQLGVEGEWVIHEAVIHNFSAPYRLAFTGGYDIILKEISVEVVDQKPVDISSVVPDVEVHEIHNTGLIGELSVNVTPTPWVAQYQVDYREVGTQEWKTVVFPVTFYYDKVGVRLTDLTFYRNYDIRVQGIGLQGEKTQVTEVTKMPKPF